MNHKKHNKFHIDLDLCINIMVELGLIMGFQTWVSCGTLCTPTMWSNEKQNPAG